MTDKQQGKPQEQGSVEEMAKEKYPDIESELYQPGDVDYEEMMWTILKERDAFKAGFYAASKGGGVDNWNRLLKYIDTMPFAGSEDHSHLVNLIQQEFMSMERKAGFLAASPKGKEEDATEIIKGLKDIINYFGGHDKTTEDHRMYAVAQKILKTFELSK